MAEDARISTALPKHFKTMKLKKYLGAPGCWSLVCLFLWVAENKPDGDLSGMDDEEIEIVSGWDGEIGAFVKQLRSLLFIDGAEKESKVHDWAEHNPWAVSRKKRIEIARGNASLKWGQKAINNATRSERLAQARAIGRHSAGEWQALLVICAGVCVRCGNADGPLVKDHIRPIYQGGSDAIDNLQPLCKPCNSSKGPDDTDLRPSDWRERLQDACKTSAHHPTQPNPTTQKTNLAVLDSLNKPQPVNLPRGEWTDDDTGSLVCRKLKISGLKHPQWVSSACPYIRERMGFKSNQEILDWLPEAWERYQASDVQFKYGFEKWLAEGHYADDTGPPAKRLRPSEVIALQEKSRAK